MTQEHDIHEIAAAFDAAVRAATTYAELDSVRSSFLGKRGPIKAMSRRLGSLPEDERIRRAVVLNEVSARMQAELDRLLPEAQRRELEARWRSEEIDVTLPGTTHRRGAWNPLSQVEQRSLAVLRRLGFEYREGPEVEDPYYNFDALNIPKHHPARDLQDTFWLDGNLVLRSHTTTVQARVLAERPELPIKVASAGRVYRNEAVDATHMAMFHQLEGFWLAPGLTLAHLKGVLAFVVRELYGPEVRIRFKPKYYPYTEPSIGLDISCTRCRGAGCDACHSVGWVTLMGAGMIHPNVLREFGYHRPGVRGLAFGWGTTRMTAQWLELNKVRRLYETQQRHLRYLTRGLM
ncbi:phenylalanine--tRNA ligase subunit alpha [Nonomuraea mesophila]|uniref:Phenylalanine--tRNA ligase alpha subunit n=1 Tax=Nonomuraea mesophila TaxID=2530382 RepID=A0A4R5FVK7_9ACTN|nr:phenylalanine--tRNA ligase subunit alpha [Nonomuraea mesophila]TDE57740.1 phenylalanine--tRNA ligase subunit alpha [Nonomuraea mesophila]